MNKKVLQHFLMVILCLYMINICQAQTDDARIKKIEKQLELARDRGVPVAEKITITMSGEIQELVSFLAESTSLNVTIEPAIQKKVSVSFIDAIIADVILYLCDAYQLELRFIGNIIQLVNYSPPKVPKVIPKAPKVEYDAASGLVTLDLRRDTLEVVARQISELSRQNIVLQPDIRSIKVSGYVHQVSLEAALQQLANNNNLELSSENNYFKLSVAAAPKNNGTTSNKQNQSGQAPPDFTSENLVLQQVGSDLVNLQAVNVPILDIIQAAALQLKMNYFILPEKASNFGGGASNRRRDNNNNRTNTTNASTSDKISIQLQQVNFEKILKEVIKNSSYTFTKEAGLYIIGRRTSEGLRTTRLLQLDYRSAKGIINHIPEDFFADVFVDTLLEYNSLVLSGSPENIHEIERFIRSIDRLVPVIMIELMIVDVQTNKLDELGLEAGIKTEPTTTEGTIISSNESRGGVDLNLGSVAINGIIDLLSGAGFVNLGQVGSNFYVNLKAVQEDGIIDIKSTPKLSTLNGHAATLSIGETRYYQEQQFNFPGSDNPIPVQSNTFQSVEANLDINIFPVVSGDEQVTLEISFEQSEFLGQPTSLAPPPQVSRRFDSMIRVRNGETVVLGGLERESKTSSRSGVPWLNRIPVIGWLFGKKRKSKSKSKLLIFVKPTIIN